MIKHSSAFAECLDYPSIPDQNRYQENMRIIITVL